MRYAIREKIFSFGDDFIIKDETGIERFHVKGKVFALGDKLRIYDMEGREQVYIEQKLFRFLPEYTLYHMDRPVARVKKQLTFFRPRFDIESSMGSYTIDGNFLGMDFSILKNGTPVAFVSKKWFAWSDSYGVDIIDTENHSFILALVIVIDQVLHDNRNKN